MITTTDSQKCVRGEPMPGYDEIRDPLLSRKDYQR